MTTDIRGYSQKKMSLYRFNFRQSHAGLTHLQVVIQTIGLSTLSGVNGALVSFTAIWATGLLSSENVSKYTILPGVVVVSTVLVTLLVIAQRGFIAVVVLCTIFLAILGITAVLFQNESINVTLMFDALATILELLVTWLIALTIASARSHSISVLVNLLIAALLGIAIVLFLANQPNTGVQIDLGDMIVIIYVFTTGGIIGWNTFNPDSKFSGIAQLAVNLTSIGGTSFYKSDLTEADFSDAILKHTDFRDAKLTRTCWHNTKGLEFSRLDNTYLANPKIRQLVIKCEGRGGNFDGLDLTGVNLQEAKLQKASFIGANLNHSNLRNTDLSGAILKQTQLENTDLSGAVLTGAYIEDWGITSTTKLENVQCEYVYMRVPTEENRNPLRKPDNEREIFADGEFADFIKPYFDTLDLYHRQNIDPRAISIALKNLAGNNPDAQLKFVAIEWRGNGINVRYTTAPGIDKSELSHEYFTDYAQISKELLGNIQRKFAAQDAEINTMNRMIDKFMKTGTHIYKGETTVNSSDNSINIKTGGNAAITGLSSGDGVLTISGNVTQTINQLPDSPAESDQPNIKALLTQLQQAIQTDTDLSDPDKSDLLEQVQALAEAKQTEEPAKREGLMRKAMKMFDATLKSLPETAKIVEACSKLLPLVLTSLGFPV